MRDFFYSPASLVLCLVLFFSVLISMMAYSESSKGSRVVELIKQGQSAADARCAVYGDCTISCNK